MESLKREEGERGPVGPNFSRCVRAEKHDNHRRVKGPMHSDRASVSLDFMLAYLPEPRVQRFNTSLRMMGDVCLAQPLFLLRPSNI